MPLKVVELKGHLMKRNERVNKNEYYELYEDCLKRNYRASKLEKGGGDRLRVWVELCRDIVLQNCLNTNSQVLQKFIDSELQLNILNTGISKY
jgi:hypothetical protein